MLWVSLNDPARCRDNLVVSHQYEHYSWPMSLFSQKLSPPMVNGWSLITSVMSNVLGRNGTCRLRGWHVDMPLVICLVFSLSCLLIKQVEFAAPMYCKSHWISCYVDDAFRRSYLCMPRSRFYSHHVQVMLLFLPRQRYEKKFGGRTSM